MIEKFEKKVELTSWLQNPDIEWGAEDAAAQGARGCFSEKSAADIQREELAEIVKAAENIANLEDSIKTIQAQERDNPRDQGAIDDREAELEEAKLRYVAEVDKYEQRKDTIFKETSGRGHGAVLDQSCFSFSIDNLSRASTLFLCAPEYAAHLQQSLRRATAERGVHTPEALDERGRKLMTAQFGLYDRMQAAGVPAEDARFILPLYTRTAIETTLNARELQHLHSMSQKDGVPTEIKDTIEQMVSRAAEVAPRLMQDRKTNYEVLAWFPAPQLFAKRNRTMENLAHNSDQLKDGCPTLMGSCGKGLVTHEGIEYAIKERDEAELANLKHYHFTFLAGMSLATFHQATRQRTWNQSVEPIYHAVQRAKFVTPPSMTQSKFRIEYEDLMRESIDYVSFNQSPETIGVLPHALKVTDLIHINGWNAIHSIGKRTCTEAQWEIRGIAKEMARSIKEVCPEIGRYAVPQGIIYGKCPERKSCGLCDKKDK